MAVQPDNVWYARVTGDDLDEICGSTSREAARWSAC